MPILALPSLDPQQHMDAEREDVEEEKEEGAINFFPIIRPQAEQPSDPTPSNVMARVLGELAPVEAVAKSTLRT